ncbi:MFS transporter [Conexibacter stalactiti]|uniref:MFS transporter n=1 Tax=Conexibacter stalactiti TaxID=1940611 RepID=A0ABU4HIG2_9ACTN|nr:MFS transporter [Conexibacter stalactiti]MDW5593102.1 MFS transporter [Conexibacter stalactiti]MEC5033743.1 MFS transporter [Conexibacter stalactiti]
MTPNAEVSKDPRRWLVLVVVATGLLLIALDMSVLYTALPTLTEELHASASEKLWIINAYPLVVAGLLLGTGTLGDRIGHKKMFVSGLAIFGAGSLLAAFAPSPQVLIGGRVLLGVGAATMMPATLALMRITFTDERERNLAIAIWGSISVVGAALGPLVGGLLLEYLWWGSVFIINVPIVIAAIVAAAVIAPGSAGNPDKPWDLLGSLLAMAGLVGVVFAIKEVAKPDRSPTLIVAALAFAAIGFLLFALRQRGREHPLIDLQVFRNPTGVIGAGIAMFTLAGVQLMSTQRLQLVDDFSPLKAGVLVTALAFGTLLTAIPGGAILHRVGFRPLISGGLALAAAGVLAVVLLFDAGTGWLVASLFVVGSGLGLVMAVASSAIVGNVPEHRAGMASSVDEVSYELGNLTGVAILGSVAAAIYTSTLDLPAGAPAAAEESLDGARAAAEGMPAPAADALLAAAHSAFDGGFTVVMVITLAVLALSTLATTALLRRRGGRPQPAAA